MRLFCLSVAILFVLVACQTTEQALPTNTLADGATVTLRAATSTEPDTLGPTSTVQATESNTSSPTEIANATNTPPLTETLEPTYEPTEAASPSVGLMARKQICLQVSDEESKARIAQELGAALAEVHKHPDWEAAIGGELAITGECEVQLPDRLLLLQFDNIGPGNVETPSPWRTVIVVLNEESASKILGENNLVRASYEIVKFDGHNSEEATSALVVRDGFLSDPLFVKSLSDAVGLSSDWLPDVASLLGDQTIEAAVRYTEDSLIYIDSLTSGMTIESVMVVPETRIATINRHLVDLLPCTTIVIVGTQVEGEFKASWIETREVTAAAEGQYMGRVGELDLNMRANPIPAVKVLEVLPPQTTLSLRGRCQSWLAVTAPSGQRGWVNSKYVDYDEALMEILPILPQKPGSDAP